LTITRDCLLETPMSLIKPYFMPVA
jgi:hypothetical protein